MIDKTHPDISVRRQCELIGVSRQSVYYQARSEREHRDLNELRHISEVLHEFPFYGYRKVALELIQRGIQTSKKRVRRIMRRFGLRSLYTRPHCSQSRKEHKTYPYLLAGKVIRYPNQVWASDISYIRLPGGYVYVVAIIDLYSRKVLSWRLSNSMTGDFCIEALEEALETYGCPAIFNTDQGSQFTSEEFTRMLKAHHIDISMDGKGRALDNIYIERLWRTLKYEDIYLREYENMVSLRDGLTRYFHFYNSKRFHQSLGYQVPDEWYESFQPVHTDFERVA